MSQKQPKRPMSPAPAGVEEMTGRVRELIAAGHSKAALQAAKDLHKTQSTESSQTLLVDAYRARIEDLLKLKMGMEARTLLKIVIERFPSAAPSLGELEWRTQAAAGNLDSIVAPLADPDLASNQHERIEQFLLQGVDNLAALASVPSLPAGHALRVAAAALDTALRLVTSGPVEDEALALTEVSRRSPLASWKALIRAIAAFYRQRDEESKKWLSAIAPGSVPARVVPALTSMMDGMVGENRLTPAGARLTALASDPAAALGRSLAELDTAFNTGGKQSILGALQGFSRIRASCEPGLRKLLCAHIWARCVLHGIPIQQAQAAVGGAVERDAYSLRLLARALDEMRSEETSAEAVMVWELFREAAIREKWFARGGLEDGVLALHQAEVTARLSPEIVEDLEGYRPSPITEGKPARAKLPTPQEFYQRAGDADPCAEVFQSWLGWASRSRGWKAADEVALRWRKVCPREVLPLVHLMKSAELRKAWHKALGYLDQAEQLDRLDPEVRRTKFRLLVASALRHLEQHKFHLVSGEAERLLALEEVYPGDAKALVAALLWCCAAVDREKDSIAQRKDDLDQLVGQAAANLLLSAVVRAGPAKRLPVPSIDLRHTSPSDLLAGVARACLLGSRAGIDVLVPLAWGDRMIAVLERGASALDAAQLLVLGEAALAAPNRKLAYAASSAGLAAGTSNAKFLFLRAQALPAGLMVRQEGCLLAALGLARIERDVELAGKILDWTSRDSRTYGWFPESVGEMAIETISSEVIGKIREEELRLNKFPVYGDRLPGYARLLPNSDYADEDEDSEDDDIFDMLDVTPEGVLNELGRLLKSLPRSEAEQVAKLANRELNKGVDAKGVDDIFGRLTSRGRPGGRKPAKRTPSEQQELF